MGGGEILSKHSSSVGYVMIITPFSEPHAEVTFIAQLYDPFVIQLNMLVCLKVLIKLEGNMRIGL